MKTLSGLVLDRYDDVDGALANERIAALEKTARRFTHDELERLPDETFAVILEDSGQVFKKYSMADAGNLGLSIEYFMANGHKLPVEAQKVAAANLLRGCSWYGVEPPQMGELEKIAIGLMNLAITAATVPGSAREAQSRIQAIKGAPGIMTPQQVTAKRLQMGV